MQEQPRSNVGDVREVGGSPEGKLVGRTVNSSHFLGITLDTVCKEIWLPEQKLVALKSLISAYGWTNGCSGSANCCR